MTASRSSIGATAGLVCVVLLMTSDRASGCSVGELPTIQSVIRDADMILMGTAARYVRKPQPDAAARLVTVPGFNQSEFLALHYGEIEFHTIATIKGDAGMPPMKFIGRFAPSDDFNEQTVPYRSVRPDGLKGACYAYSYREGANYLLFLRRTPEGKLTP